MGTLGTRTRRLVVVAAIALLLALGMLAATLVGGGHAGVIAGGKVGIDPGGPLGWVGVDDAAAGFDPNGGNPCSWRPDDCMSAR